jgi:hypothetical protein
MHEVVLQRLREILQLVELAATEVMAAQLVGERLVQMVLVEPEAPAAQVVTHTLEVCLAVTIPQLLLMHIQQVFLPVLKLQLAPAAPAAQQAPEELVEVPEHLVEADLQHCNILEA